MSGNTSNHFSGDDFNAAAFVTVEYPTEFKQKVLAVFDDENIRTLLECGLDEVGLYLNKRKREYKPAQILQRMSADPEKFTEEMLEAKKVYDLYAEWERVYSDLRAKKREALHTTEVQPQGMDFSEGPEGP